MHSENNYERIKILGEGSYGKAYLSQNKKTRLLYVIKQLDLNSMEQGERQQAMKEARILQALNHPNIIRFKQSYKTKSNKLHIVMDYADGGDLCKKMKQAKGVYFNQNQILNWFTQLCLAIKHIHDRKIVHRDIKSQNVFLTREGIVKLGDFGIAKVLMFTRQKIKTKVGTPYYLSPQICESKDYSFKTDIWSLGVILYEMIALKPPFDANSLPALAIKISKGDYSPLPLQFSKQLKRLVNQLLTVDPALRPSISQVLKMPIIKSRISAYLSKSIRDQEFSHTVLHNKNILQDKKEVRPISAVIQANPYSQINISAISQTPTGSKNIQINVRKKHREDKSDRKQTQKKEKQKGDRSQRALKKRQGGASQPNLGIYGMKIEKIIPQVPVLRAKREDIQPKESQWLEQIHEVLQEIVQEKANQQRIQQEMKQSLCMIMKKYENQQVREDFKEETPIDTLEHLISQLLGQEEKEKLNKQVVQGLANPLKLHEIATSKGKEHGVALLFLLNCLKFQNK